MHVVAVVSLENSRVSGSIASYDFLYNDCIAHNITDISKALNGFNNLILSSNDASISNQCLNSNGISSKGASASTVTNILGIGKSITIDFWIQFCQEVSDADQEIVSITSDSLSNNCNSFASIIYNNGNLTSYVCPSTTNTYPVYFDQVPVPRQLLELNELIHVTYTLTLDSSIWNKKTLYTYTSQFLFNGVTDDRYIKEIYILSSVTLSMYNQGAYIEVDAVSSHMYSLDVYAFILTTQQIEENYKSKIPNSKPVVSDYTISINEDAMVGNHYKTPKYYQHMVPVNQTDIIPFKWYDFDEQASNPNYNSSDYKKVLVQVLSINSNNQGTFYKLDAVTEITISSLPMTISIDATANIHGFHFRPLRDISSYPGVAATITYAVFDSITNLPSIDNATISIIIDPVNDPPVLPDTSIVSATAYTKTIVSFNTGFDIDSHIRLVWIDTLPTIGSLHAMASNGTILHKLVSGNVSITTNDKFQAMYLYEASEISSDDSGFLANDTIIYHVSDVEGRASTSSTLTVSIYTSLSAIPTAYSYSRPSAVEETTSSIKINGIDKSDSGRSVKIRVIATPKHGTIYHDSDCNNAIAPSEHLSTVLTQATYTTGVNVYYRSSSNYFTYPNKMWDGKELAVEPDYFTFETVVDDGSDAVSKPVVQYIGIKNVNDPTVLQFTSAKDVIEVYAMTSKVSTEGKEPTAAVIGGISIHDPDLNVDVVKVHIQTTNGGMITLNQNISTSVIFLGKLDSFDYCYTMELPCTGDGIEDEEIVFIGMPADVELVLNGMMYINTNANVKDTINITIYDGVGDACLDESSHDAYSIRNECYTSQVSIDVSVLDHSNAENSLTTSIFAFLDGLSFYAKIALLAGVSIIVLIILRCAWLKFRSDVNRYKWYLMCVSYLLHSLCCCCCFGGEKRNKKGGRHGDDYDAHDIEKGISDIKKQIAHKRLHAHTLQKKSKSMSANTSKNGRASDFDNSNSDTCSDASSSETERVEIDEIVVPRRSITRKAKSTITATPTITPSTSSSKKIGRSKNFDAFKSKSKQFAKPYNMFATRHRSKKSSSSKYKSNKATATASASGVSNRDAYYSNDSIHDSVDDEDSFDMSNKYN